ncbi:MAG: hypothetical protein KAX23_06250, partial [Dehalococcoidia bacterium]|nr:hypothetical protein [Dehalococcoidia bacterium]
QILFGDFIPQLPLGQVYEKHSAHVSAHLLLLSEAAPLHLSQSGQGKTIAGYHISKHRRWQQPSH